MNVKHTHTPHTHLFTSPPQVDYRALVLTAREVAAAMTYLHSRNILHGDLTGVTGRTLCVCV